ncbi:(d)CMP kinase [soil metagenome]
MIITIDGPSISGKTSIARMLARHLHFEYLSSGSLFRGLAYILVHQFGYHESQLASPAPADIRQALRSDNVEYRYSYESGEQLFWQGKDILPLLADQKIGKYASIIGTNQEVRNALAQLQHAIAHDKDIVTDGRDAGSVIFPQAEVKFFLTASLHARAARWQANQNEIGREIDIEQALQEISERDERDTNRSIAPLRIPEGAFIIDSSTLTKEQVLGKIVQEINKKGGK